MLRLIHKDTGQTYKFYVIDSHHHLGEDEDGMEVKPVGTNNSYSFCQKVIRGTGDTKGLIKLLKEEDEKYSWKLPKKGFLFPHPLLEKWNVGNEKRGSFTIDQIVVFPMHDVFRKKGKIEYQASNNFVSKWTGLFPHSLKFIGYGRLNPSEPEKQNLEELNRIVNECDLRGLKLHPSSDDFDIGADKVKTLVKNAALLNLPVIFHTTYGSEVKKLHNMADDIISEFIREDKESAIPQLKIIIGHCTYQSKDVFRALTHPSIYGEMSTLSNPMKYLQKVSKEVNPRIFINHVLPGITNKEPTLTKKKLEDIFGYGLINFSWHHKIMVGTDHPYMPVSKLIDLFDALLSNKLNLKPSSIQNILGSNLLRIIPPVVAPSDTVFSKDEIQSKLVKEGFKFAHLDPMVEPLPSDLIRTDKNILTFKKNDEKLTFIHRDISLEPLDESNDYIEYEQWSDWKTAVNHSPYLKSVSNPRILPVNPQYRRLFNDFKEY